MHGSCPARVKEACYKSMVRPVVEYCSVVWSPFTNTSINLVELVQHRAARFVTGDYGFMSSVTGMLNSLGWTSLEYRREISLVIMLFKILHNEISIPSYANNYMYKRALSKIQTGVSSLKRLFSLIFPAMHY